MNPSLLRFVCVLQFALCGYMALSSFVYVFNAPGWHSIMSFIAFCAAVYLCVFVLQVIYKNFPDSPLSMAQKSTFNFLFVINFFMLAALITYNINDVQLWIGAQGTTGFSGISPLFYAEGVLHLLITIFQVFILLGMVKLRRMLNSNFEKKTADLDILQ